MRSYGIVLLAPTSRGNNVAIVKSKLNYGVAMILQFAENKSMARKMRVAWIVDTLHTLSPTDRQEFLRSPESVLFPLYGPKRVYKVLDVIKEACSSYMPCGLTSKRATDGTWSVPKGRMKREETSYDTALRETIEETGYTQDDFRLISHKPFTITYSDKYGKTYELNLYIAMMEKTVEDKEIDDARSEISKVKWISQDDIKCYLPMEYADLLTAELRKTLKNKRRKLSV